MLEAEAELLWQWLGSRGQLLPFPAALLFLWGVTVGAALAAVASWVEARLAMGAKPDAGT
jgi:hypothetical protein